MRITSVAMVALVLVASGVGAEEGAQGAAAPPRILASEFPQTAARVMYFEQRINSPESSVRRRVLTEAGYFSWPADAEFVAFLKRMYKDPDPVVRGSAVRTLYDMWVPQNPRELPVVFSGYGSENLIDRSSPKLVQDLLKRRDTYAVYDLGLLQAEEALPLFRELAATPGVFANNTAARALLACGDRSGAAATFNKIAAEQLRLYAVYEAAHEDPEPQTKAPTPERKVHPWYAAQACRGLIDVGGDERRRGLESLVELMGYLERSEDVNDQSNLHGVRAMLAEQSGQYFTTSAEAAQWLAGVRWDEREVGQNGPVGAAADAPRHDDTDEDLETAILGSWTYVPGVSPDICRELEFRADGTAGASRPYGGETIRLAGPHRVFHSEPRDRFQRRMSIICAWDPQKPDTSYAVLINARVEYDSRIPQQKGKVLKFRDADGREFVFMRSTEAAAEASR